MNVDIFIPARLGSTRLPKKHLEKINGIPLIEILVNRLKNSKKIRQIIVCTTTSNSDDQLVEFLKTKNIMYFRGSERDILKRFLDAAKQFGTDIIIDVEGDKLYTEPEFVDKIITEIEDNDYDFVIGNDSDVFFNPNHHFIHGIVPTAIRVSALKKIYPSITQKNRETGYKEIFVNNSLIKKKFFIFNSNLEIPSHLRLTIDYPEDLEFAKELLGRLQDDYTYHDILKAVYNNPNLLKIIENINNKWFENYKEEMENFSSTEK
ncbi:MAG: acylneuraminate cytidylyltransferase [Thermoproteota archaeon]